jgi:hypothetical protein
MTNCGVTLVRLVVYPLSPARPRALTSRSWLTDFEAPVSLMKRLRLTGA